MPVYTLFGQQPPGAGLQSDATAYTLGVQFSVNAAGATLTGMWFYSPAPAGVLPQSFGLYDVAATSLVHAEVPAWSGAAGSGWVHAVFASPPALTAGKAYKAVVLQNTAANWYAATSAYWTTGAGSGGISGGPVTAPNNASASPGQDSFNAGAVITYPASSNGANYWIDPEVTALAGGIAVNAALAAAGIL